ncbi:MAG TPA: efflux RND transporter periplasmic adaptor subunit [Steroidobacteraceae bacterium]|jgi:HlyD family secretion protein
MKIAELKRMSNSEAPTATVRGTEQQDVAISGARRPWHKSRILYASAAGTLVLALLSGWLLREWSNSSHVISAARLQIATVKSGHFVRDVAAQGTVIAAVSPTLFSIAPGTVSYLVRAGDTVAKDQVLATLDSPELNNEYQRERATLDSLNAALEHQQLEIRRQLLTSKQQADLAQVAINAAERELKRAQWAWGERAMSERDYRRAIDDVSTAKLNFEHARDTAKLERESVVLDLRTRRLERDRQSLVVENLKRRVEELNVRSPVNGMVANLGQAEKARVADGTPLITVVDLSAFELEFQVAEIYARDIKTGMAADITLNGHTEPGKVTAISPEVRQNQVIGRVRFSHGQPPGLRQNERAAVRIVLDERDHVVTFERGPVIDETTRYVYVLHGDRAVRTPVQLGAASVSEIEVLHGLAAGDRVIVSDMRDFNDTPELLISN